MIRKVTLRKTIFSVVCCLLTQPTFGLDCYNCDYWGGRTGDDSGCQYNPPPKRYLEYCYTSLCSVKYATKRGKVYTTRKCSHATNIRKGCYNVTFRGDAMGSEEFVGTQCVCSNRNGCNKAWRLSICIPGLWILISLSILGVCVLS